MAKEFKVAWVVSEPPRIVPFSFGREVFDEGEYAQVSSGDLPLKMSWSLQGSDTEIRGGDDPGITTAPMGARASFLSIESVGSRHGGEYTCTASNKAGIASYSTRLRVNGKLGRGTGRQARKRSLECVDLLSFTAFLSRASFADAADVWQRHLGRGGVCSTCLHCQQG
jgi:hypothetical protein